MTAATGAYTWLIEVEGAASTLRWSVYAQVVTDAAGTEYEYRAGLEELSVAVGDLEIDVTITDAAVDWPALAPRFRRARVTLRRWEIGTILERATVVARGRAASLEHGAIGEPAAWTIADASHAPSADVPDVAGQVTRETWPDVINEWATNPSQIGQYYPIVFGRPGHLPELDPYTTSAILYPCVPVPHPRELDDPLGWGGSGRPSLDYLWYVVSEDATTATPTEVWLWSPEGIFSTSQTVAAYEDALGRTVLGTHAGANGEQIPSQSDTVYAGFPADTTGIRDAYSVIEYVLRRWAPDTVDWARMEEVRDLLGAFAVDTWIGERVDGGDVGPAWKWVEGLIEHLPVRVRVGARGRYLARHWVTVDTARTRRALSADDGEISRVSPITYRSWDGPYSALRLTYADAPGFDAGVLGSLLFGPVAGQEPAQSGIGYSWYSVVEVRAHGRLAYARDLGVVRTHEVELPWTWDRDTAAAVGEYLIERDALEYREVRYLTPESYGLEEGDQLAVTDTAVGLDGTLALVDAPPLITPEGTVVTLRIPTTAV